MDTDILTEIENTSYHLGEAIVLLRELVVKARADGISWDAIGQRMVPPVSRQAAQQRFARYCAAEFLGDWEAIKGEKNKLIYWRRERTDKSYLTVASFGERGWEWAHRPAWNGRDIKEATPYASGWAGTAATAKKAAEAAVGG